jgi:hypothetical protein
MYWPVKSAPIKNEHGEAIVATEMSLDLAHIKYLEIAKNAGLKEY